MFPVILALFLAATNAKAADFNSYILEAINKMPVGLGYSQSQAAGDALQKSMHMEQGQMKIQPELASPSYCSGATYLVFLLALQNIPKLSLATPVWEKLLVLGQHDGTDSWGRWNSNGPGTGRFFFEVGAGKNFTSFEEAKPGDFLKIFWNENIGRTESGHSVVYLGLEQQDGEEYVKFWSSNSPMGFSFRSVPRADIVRAVFSRLENPWALEKILTMPVTDDYLASMLVRESTEEEMFSKIGIEK